jgi:hypothetical protein
MGFKFPKRANIYYKECLSMIPKKGSNGLNYIAIHCWLITSVNPLLLIIKGYDDIHLGTFAAKKVDVKKNAELYEQIEKKKIEETTKIDLMKSIKIKKKIEEI